MENSLTKHGIIVVSEDVRVEVANSCGKSVMTSPLATFSEGKQVFIIEYEAYNELQRNEVVRRLRKFLAEA